MPLAEIGSDFHGGAIGGRPRTLPLVEGDLVPLDAGICYRGYHADLCRTVAVGRATAPQQDAFERVAAALTSMAGMVSPGVTCADVYRHAKGLLDGYRGWSFDGHLGHGIGLDGHETPRINPKWNDSFAEGDVITLEPGLYDADLRFGVRLEENYLVTATGLKQLSSLPLSLSGTA